MGYDKNKYPSSGKKSYIAGKITGRYMAEGKSYKEAKHIADTVVNRNLKGSFGKSKFSKNAFRNGWHNGHDE